MTSFWRADLHAHSSRSDGTLSPLELLRHAADSGLQGLSITDHDTLAAYDEKTWGEARRLSLSLLAGIELSTSFLGHETHILAYAFVWDAPSLRQVIEANAKRRARRNRVILEKLKEKGFSLTEEEVLSSSLGQETSSLGRPHIARAMLDKGYVTSIAQAFQDFLRTGAPCHEPGELLSLEETLEAIHLAGGIAALAHPHLMEDTLAVQALSLPFDAVEVYYGSMSLERNQRWSRLASKKNLLSLGGSDFHGTTRPRISLGHSWTPLETFRFLWERQERNNPLLPLSPPHERLPDDP